jgi:RimJ/RimL family protein N-acetyltransferase
MSLPGDQGYEREARIRFRPLSLEDMPRMLAWLSDSDVSPWYGEGALTIENITAKYRGPVQGTEPTRSFIVTIDGTDAGYIQAYVIDDHPEYARQIELPASAVGTDLFLGEPAVRGQGWGVPVLRAFHRRIVFGEMGATLAVIAPSPDNARAIHVYEGAGFRWLKTVPILDEEPQNTGDEYVMTMTADGFLTGVSLDDVPFGSQSAPHCTAIPDASKDHDAGNVSMERPVIGRDGDEGI